MRKHLGKVHGLDVLYKSQSLNLKQNSIIGTNRKRQLNKAILQCIIRILDSRPFGDFAKQGMKHFLSVCVPGYVPEHRTTIAKKLKSKYDIFKKKLIEKFEKVDHVALTTDLWKARNGIYYLCKTGHFF